jgi:pimeloyl-ACP methyl ester carboxylesterase
MRKLSFLLAVLAVAACAKTSTPAAVPQDTGPKAGPGCLDSTTHAKQITFGQGLVGIVFGTGTTGVVLAHQNGGSACQWLITADELVQKGYRVLAFDFAGFGGSPTSAGTSRAADVAEAVKAIRAQGVTKVALAGGSMGGTAVIAAAATITPPVQAVISLSAPAVFAGADAMSAAPKLTIPVLYMSAIGESTYTQNAKDMHAASKASADAQLLVVKGNEHGVSVVMTGVGTTEAIDAFYGFLAKHAPA